MKIFWFLFLAFCIFSLEIVNFVLAADCKCLPTFECVNNECVRKLDLVYPKIFGEETPGNVRYDLAKYIEYIFKISIYLIGLIIFGALVFSGVQYLTSTGNPAQLSSAKSGILSAFFGAIILLSAVIIFNTIHPQFFLLKPAEIALISSKVEPGVYICNFKFENEKIGDKTYSIQEILNKYTSGSTTTQLEAVKAIREVINPLRKNRCIPLYSSGILEDEIKSNRATIFILPRESVNPEDLKDPQKRWIYEYGVVLHENDNFSGKCKILPELELVSGGRGHCNIYHQFKSFYLDDQNLHFSKIRSITLFQKEITPEGAEGVTLYEGLNYNEYEPEESTPTRQLSSKYFLPTGADALAVNSFDLSGANLFQNTRSIKFHPSPPQNQVFLAVLMGNKSKEKDQTEKDYNVCQVIFKDDNDLTDDPIGLCGDCGKNDLEKSKKINEGKCYPCVKAMYVIKGKRL